MAGRHHGVKKLIAINSGKYAFAEIDLSRPVHLSAPNNQGKSTLVNALQFLYVDELRSMGFGSRNHDDTRRHYFGENPSYLVFECLTPLGPKCMLVAGQGPLNNCRFLRFVVDGEFCFDDFRAEDGHLRTLEELRPVFAGRGLAEVRPGNLWEVLGDPQIRADGVSIPRLNILPIHTKEEYRSFRAAFTRLLSLNNVNAKELRELIITSHARDVTCRRIDVAGEHRDEFQRAEQAERRLQFTLAVQNQVEKGRTLREEIEAIAQGLRAEAPMIAEERDAVFASVDRLNATLDEERARIEDAVDAVKEQIAEQNQTIGELRGEMKSTQRELDEIDALHAKWASSTDDMIDAMRGNVAALDDRVSRLRDDLEHAERFDLDSLQRGVERLETERAAKQRVIDNWDSRAVDALRELGIDDAELDRVFRLLNAGLLDLSVGGEVEILDRAALKARLRAINESINEGKFVDKAITIDLGALAGPAVAARRTREEVQSDLAVVQSQLKRSQEQLAVAENQAHAEKSLLEAEQERRILVKKLQEYDTYRRQWANRDQVEAALQKLTGSVKAVQDGIERLNQQERSESRRLEVLAARQRECETAQKEIQQAIETYREDEAVAGVDAPIAAIGEASGGDPEASPSWEQISKRAQSVSQRLESMNRQMKSLIRKRRTVEEVQKEIRDTSKEFSGQTIYFSEPDSDWDRLIQMIESLAEQQESVEQSWSSLFTRVAAKLSDIHHGVSEIRTAINRINRGLTDYRVSNLRSVKLEVVTVNQTYGMIETLTNEGGIFQDHERIDRAKDQMRQWIRDNATISLDELFEIHIHVHDADRERPTKAKSLDEIGSTGTGMTAKAMVFVQLVRAVVPEERYHLHFFLDETGQLDERNLAATTRMAVDKGVMPITADPDVRIEPLAHPIVTVYSLGQNAEGKFIIDGKRTYRARRLEEESNSLVDQTL